MTRCLDEAKLQSYFDGELSIEMMESVTSHLASCVTCAAAARELEEETALLMAALSAEFEASVPTERLRQRIDAAVLGERVAIAQATRKDAAVSQVSFAVSSTLEHSELSVMRVWRSCWRLRAIVGVVKMRSDDARRSSDSAVADNKQPKQPNRSRYTAIRCQRRLARQNAESNGNVASRNAENRRNLPSSQNFAPTLLRSLLP